MTLSLDRLALRATLRLVALLVSLAAATPAHAQGSLLKRIKDDAKRRAAAAAAQAGTKVVEHSGAATDSTLQKGVTGVDSAAGRASDVFAERLGKAQSHLPGFLGGRKGGATQAPPASTAAPATAAPAPRLPDRAPLAQVEFQSPTDTLTAASVAYLQNAAHVLTDDGGTWTVEATVPPGSDARRDAGRAARRAESVRAALVAAGVPAERLRTIGRGGAAAGAAPAVEVVRTSTR